MGYRDQDEDSPPPPVLPPRNYRASTGGPSSRSTGLSNSQALSSSSGLMERRPLPPLPKKQQMSPPAHKPVTPSFAASISAGSAKSSDVTTTQDYDSTPKADYYADQLRAQSRRLSQNKPAMLNAAWYQSKPLPEMKTSIIKSRPVEDQPRPQEARPLSGSGLDNAIVSPTQQSPPITAAPPQPALYRSNEFDRGLNFVGVSPSPPNNGAQPSVEPLSSRVNPTPPSPRQSYSPQDYNANHPRNQPDSTGLPSDNAQLPGRQQHQLQQDYLGNQYAPSPVVRERLLGSHHEDTKTTTVTPDLPPPPTPVTGENNLSQLDESFSPPPPPLPPPLDQSTTPNDERRSFDADEDAAPNR